MDFEGSHLEIIFFAEQPFQYVGGIRNEMIDDACSIVHNNVKQ